MAEAQDSTHILESLKTVTASATEAAFKRTARRMNRIFHVFIMFNMFLIAVSLSRHAHTISQTFDPTSPLAEEARCLAVLLAIGTKYRLNVSQLLLA
jgi:hypothetical protein